ncbi:hypothetical protein XF_2072 [Xylella fastidiosa 9a5c]|uniref:Uncharacterized protein n=1 Tax=Xylella fastidiosa (strain 9a5c) TaxID=160492 RepID=Q9PBR8_XYLFA|nr:hypothetical protein XF_2072 [Xylella fastidiosa 9a5c]
MVHRYDSYRNSLQWHGIKNKVSRAIFENCNALIPHVMPVAFGVIFANDRFLDSIACAFIP